MIIVSFGGCGRLPILLFFFQNILFDIYREKEEQLKLILSYSLKLFHIYIYIYPRKSIRSYIQPPMLHLLVFFNPSMVHAKMKFLVLVL